MPALRQQHRGGRCTSEPGAEIVRPWAAVTQPVLAILRTSIQVFGTPQRYPQQEAVARIPEDLHRHGPQPLDVNLGLIGMQGIGVSVLSGSGPWVQNAGPPLRFLGAHVEERLADVKDALRTDTERSDLADLVIHACLVYAADTIAREESVTTEPA